MVRAVQRLDATDVGREEVFMFVLLQRVWSLVLVRCTSRVAFRQHIDVQGSRLALP